MSESSGQISGDGVPTLGTESSSERGPAPHVHVIGDVAELHAYLWEKQVPDHDDPAVAAYRRLKGFVERAIAGGAWSVAQFIRAGVCDVWKCNSSWDGFVS